MKDIFMGLAILFCLGGLFMANSRISNLEDNSSKFINKNVEEVQK